MSEWYPGTDIFSVTPPEPIDTPLEEVMASTIPPELQEPTDG
jgi:hypothetical protein